MRAGHIDGLGNLGGTPVFTLYPIYLWLFGQVNPMYPLLYTALRLWNIIFGSLLVPERSSGASIEIYVAFTQLLN